MDNKICFIVCKNFYNELNTIIKQLDYKHVVLQLHPADCAIRKKMGPEVIESIIDNMQEDCQHFEIICSHGCMNVEELKTKYPETSIITHNTCFNYLLDENIVNYFIQNGAYLLTPGWLNSWEHYVKTVWGFNADSAADFFKDSSNKLLLLDTGLIAGIDLKLKQMADFTSMPFETIPISLDSLKKTVNERISEFKTKMDKKFVSGEMKLKNEQIANYAMIVDMFNALTTVDTEEKVIEDLFALIGTLFGASVTAIISIKDGKIISKKSNPENHDIHELVDLYRSDPDKHYRWSESGTGFCVRITSNGNAIAYILIDQIPFHAYKDKYLNQFLIISDLIGLALLNARNYTALDKAQHELKIMAYHDSMTGLLNRRSFIERLDETILDAKRREESFALMFIDLDNFKAINDLFGHDIGDAVIIEVAKRLTLSTRASDILARIGGDEYTVTLKNIDSLENAQKAVAKIIDEINKEFSVKDHTIKLSASIGVALYPHDDKTCDGLIKKADSAMYQIKEQKRSSYLFYQDVMPKS